MLPPAPVQLPAAGCWGRGLAAPCSITALSGLLPRKIDGGHGHPAAFAPFSARLGAGKKKKAGGRGRAGKQSRFFLLRAGIFFYFFFKVGWSPSLFLGGEYYFKLFGRLWVSPGHPVLTKVRPFWRGSEQNSGSLFPQRWAPNPGWPPASRRHKPAPGCNICCVLPSRHHFSLSPTPPSSRTSPRRGQTLPSCPSLTLLLALTPQR